MSSLKQIYGNSVHKAETIVGSSFTPRVALLVPPSGTVYPIVDRYKFTGS